MTLYLQQTEGNKYEMDCVSRVTLGRPQFRGCQVQQDPKNRKWPGDVSGTAPGVNGLRCNDIRVGENFDKPQTARRGTRARCK